VGEGGWGKTRIVPYEVRVDTGKYSYISMADIGNRVVGEQPVYTNLANFLEWFGPEQPSTAYFTNDFSKMPEAGKNIPLKSNERFVGLQWKRRLDPGEAATIRLAIGMAAFNPKTGLPEKPPTAWK